MLRASSAFDRVSHVSAFRIALHPVAPHKTTMFLLGGSDFPNDNATLRDALAGSLLPLGITVPAIVLDGDFPSFSAIRLDVTGAHFQRGYRIASASSEVRDSFFARSLEIKAAPAKFESLPFQVSLDAEDCVFAFGNTEKDEHVGTLRGCSGGTMEIAASISDLEATLLALAKEAASGFGASVDSIRIVAETETPRRVAITATAVAKAFMTKATLTLRGRLDIDDDYCARLSEITCTGDGMIANLAAGQLRPRLAEWERLSFPLGNVLPGGLAISDITVTAGSDLKIRAAFHSKKTGSPNHDVSKRIKS